MLFRAGLGRLPLPLQSGCARDDEIGRQRDGDLFSHRRTTVTSLALSTHRGYTAGKWGLRVEYEFTPIDAYAQIRGKICLTTAWKRFPIGSKVAV